MCVVQRKEEKDCIVYFVQLSCPVIVNVYCFVCMVRHVTKNIFYYYYNSYFVCCRPSQTGLLSETQELRSKIRESGNAKIVNGLSSATRTMEIVFAEVEKILKAVSCLLSLMWCSFFVMPSLCLGSLGSVCLWDELDKLLIALVWNN